MTVQVQSDLENKTIGQNISEQNMKENLAENVMHFKSAVEKLFRGKLFAKILVLEKDLQKRKDSEVISFIMAKLEMAKNIHLQM